MHRLCRNRNNCPSVLKLYRIIICSISPTNGLSWVSAQCTVNAFTDIVSSLTQISERFLDQCSNTLLLHSHTLHFKIRKFLQWNAIFCNKYVMNMPSSTLLSHPKRYLNPKGTTQISNPSCYYQLLLKSNLQGFYFQPRCSNRDPCFLNRENSHKICKTMVFKTLAIG